MSPPSVQLLLRVCPRSIWDNLYEPETRLAAPSRRESPGTPPDMGKNGDETKTRIPLHRVPHQ